MRSRLVRLVVFSALLFLAAAPPLHGDYWKGEVYYYSDACYTNVVGYFVRYCDNSTDSWGQTSAWANHYDFDCDAPIDPR